METQPKPKIRIRHLERIALSNEALLRVNDWISQLSTLQKGVETSRQKLINWLLLNRDVKLSASEQKSLVEEFYDEEKFIRYALKEIKAAKTKGEKLTLEDIVNRQKPKVEKTVRPKVTKQNPDPKTGNAANSNPLVFKQEV